MTVDELLEQIDDMIDKAWSFPSPAVNAWWRRTGCGT